MNKFTVNRTCEWFHFDFLLKPLTEIQILTQNVLKLKVKKIYSYSYRLL